MEPAKNEAESEQFEKDAMMKKSGTSLKAFSGNFFQGCASPDPTFSISNAWSASINHFFTTTFWLWTRKKIGQVALSVLGEARQACDIFKFQQFTI